MNDITTQPGADDGVRQELVQTLRTWAETGFNTAADLRQSIEDYTEDDEDYESVTEADLDAMVGEVLAAVRAEQSTWTAESDSDRLDRAFAALAERGILARMNFTCCGTCGAAEIGAERDDTRVWRGYTFFHQQDAERLPEGGPLFLSYGVFRPADLPAGLPESELEERWRVGITALANEIVAVLREHDLDASWNQNTGTRLSVGIDDWRRRLPPD